MPTSATRVRGAGSTPFTIYPLFNKYGTIDLGPSGNGVRLFFNESLSGVINWGIAAPLFSINFFVLAAVFQRSLSPLKQLVSARGFQGLVEQAVRVLRWGLWMAPVINSFLRQSPDPSWYNQDGAVRTGAATVANLFLPASAFKSWSVSVFTGLLAYDWLRILIWFDHMGLRVATLVNLTFIGGDRLDEVAARFTGHAGRTRVIPEGVRRFATWAPLLIPFYIPHGPDWDRAWTGAEQIGRTHPPVAAPVWSVVAVYLLAVFAAGLGFRAVARAWNGPRFSGAPTLPGVPRIMRRGAKLFRLANGALTTEIGADGRGFTAVTAMARGSHAIDITRQPLDPLDLRGPFVFIRDAGTGEADPSRADASKIWSLAYEPMRRAGPDYHVGQPDPATIALRNSWDGLRAEAWVSHAEGQPLEYTRILLTNTGDRVRRLELTSYRELAVHELGAYLRDPDFNAMHVESWFVAELGAVLARNRLLRDPRDGPHVARDGFPRGALRRRRAARRLRGFAHALHRPRRAPGAARARPGGTARRRRRGLALHLRPRRQPDGRGRARPQGPRRAPAAHRPRRERVGGRQGHRAGVRPPGAGRGRLPGAAAPEAPHRARAPAPRLEPGRSASRATRAC